MTHPLLTPRYMVEADYPNSPFRVGDILTVKHHPMHNDGEVFGLEDEEDVLKWITYAKDYPHIFRLMHWSEQRELGEMPRYLRFVDSPTHVLQVDTYLLGKVLFNEHVAWQPIEWYTPATEAEYLEYLKSKEK